MSCGDCEEAKRLAENPANHDAVEQRRSVCRLCSHATPCSGNSDLKCKCDVNNQWLSTFTVQASAVCPKGKW